MSCSLSSYPNAVALGVVIPRLTLKNTHILPTCSVVEPFSALLTGLICCLLLFLSLSGCGSLQVHQMQRRAEKGDDTWVASQAVKCDTASHACARQHLIKGQACLRLAEVKDDPADYFACAADGLAKGIALETSWRE